MILESVVETKGHQIATMITSGDLVMLAIRPIRDRSGCISLRRFGELLRERIREEVRLLVEERKEDDHILDVLCIHPVVLNAVILRGQLQIVHIGSCFGVVRAIAHGDEVRDGDCREYTDDEECEDELEQGTATRLMLHGYSFAKVRFGWFKENRVQGTKMVARRQCPSFFVGLTFYPLESVMVMKGTMI